MVPRSIPADRAKRSAVKNAIHSSEHTRVGGLRGRRERREGEPEFPRSPSHSPSFLPSPPPEKRPSVVTGRPCSRERFPSGSATLRRREIATRNVIRSKVRSESFVVVSVAHANHLTPSSWPFALGKLGNHQAKRAVSSTATRKARRAGCHESGSSGSREALKSNPVFAE